MKKECRFRSLLSPYRDGMLGFSDVRRVAAHLESCGECRDMLAQMEIVREAVREAGEVAPPADFIAGIFERLEARETRRRWFVPPGGVRRFVYAAGVFAVVLLAFLVAPRRPVSPPMELAKAPPLPAYAGNDGHARQGMRGRPSTSVGDAPASSPVGVSSRVAIGPPGTSADLLRRVSPKMERSGHTGSSVEIPREIRSDEVQKPVAEQVSPASSSTTDARMSVKEKKSSAAGAAIRSGGEPAVMADKKIGEPGTDGYDGGRKQDDELKLLNGTGSVKSEERENSLVGGERNAPSEMFCFDRLEGAASMKETSSETVLLAKKPRQRLINNMVVRSEREWTNVWNTQNSVQNLSAPLPKVDFKTQMVIVLPTVQNENTYRIVKTEERKDTVVVRYREEPLKKGEAVEPAPYQLGIVNNRPHVEWEPEEAPKPATGNQ